MKKLAFAAPIAILALVFAGCASRGPDNPTTTKVTPQQVPYWSGTGVVQAVTPAPGPVIAGPVSRDPNPSARNPAATASTTSESGMQRLRIRMDDGRMLYVDTPSRDFQAGTRVQLSDNNEIRRL
jgi:hypothetical protein